MSIDNTKEYNDSLRSVKELLTGFKNTGDKEGLALATEAMFKLRNKMASLGIRIIGDPNE